MAKFTVLVSISNQKELTVYADNEDEAEDKAADIVDRWAVDDVEVLDVFRES